MTTQAYTQVCVAAEGGTDGPGLAWVIRKVLQVFTADWAAVSDLDVAGNVRPHLLVPSNVVRVMSITELLTRLEQAEQVVWASVFLCSSSESAEQIAADEDYPASLEKSEALVRVVDAGYYYVYGPSEQMARLRGELAGEQKECLPGELDFPE